MTVLEALREVRALIADPERWTKGAYARTADGEHCDVDNDRAASWCAVGAIWKVAYLGEHGAYKLAFEAETTLKRGLHVPLQIFNDACGHTEVIGLFDRRIAELEAGELEAIPVAEPGRPEVLTPA